MPPSRIRYQKIQQANCTIARNNILQNKPILVLRLNHCRSTVVCGSNWHRSICLDRRQSVTIIGGGESPLVVNLNGDTCTHAQRMSVLQCRPTLGSVAWVSCQWEVWGRSADTDWLQIKYRALHDVTRTHHDNGNFS